MKRVINHLRLFGSHESHCGILLSLLICHTVAGVKILFDVLTATTECKHFCNKPVCVLLSSSSHTSLETDIILWFHAHHWGKRWSNWSTDPNPSTTCWGGTVSIVIHSLCDTKHKHWNFSYHICCWTRFEHILSGCWCLQFHGWKNPIFLQESVSCQCFLYHRTLSQKPPSFHWN